MLGDMTLLFGNGLVELVTVELEDPFDEKEEVKLGRTPEMVLERLSRLMGKLGVCSGAFHETESCSNELTRAGLARGEDGERDGGRADDWNSCCCCGWILGTEAW
jgi:hypothetical protein